MKIYENINVVKLLGCKRQYPVTLLQQSESFFLAQTCVVNLNCGGNRRADSFAVAIIPTCLVDRDGPVKVSFLGVPNVTRLRAPHIAPETKLKIADLLDIAGTKINVVASRAQQKNYLDVDALINAGIDLPTQLAAARLIYDPEFAPRPSLMALTYFDDGDLALLPDDVKERLVKAATAVDPLRLPSLKRTTPPRSRDGDRNQ